MSKSMRTDMINRLRRIITIALVVLPGIGILSCGPAHLETNVNEASEKAWFMVISDVHTSNSKKKMDKMAHVVSEINHGIYAQADFLVITGDCVSSFLEHREVNHDDPENNRVLKLMNVLAQLSKPVYLVMGNHEYKIDRDKDSDEPFTMAEIDTIEVMWKRYTGFKPYYSFRHEKMKFLVLNTMRGRPEQRQFDDQQISWFRDELSKGEPVILFFHHPVKTDHPRIWASRKDMVTKKTEPEFMELCKKYSGSIRGIFVGHGHLWVKDKLFREIPVYETASFGDKPDIIGYMVGYNTDSQRITVPEKIFYNESEKE